MRRAKNILKQTARILSDDVSNYRNIVFNSGGGELPASIKQKEKLLHDIEELIKISNKK